MGMLMSRQQLTGDQALTALRTASQNSNTKLRDLADTVIATGRLRRHTHRAVTTTAGKVAGVGARSGPCRIR